MKKILLVITSALMLLVFSFSVNAAENRDYRENNEWLRIIDGVVYYLNSERDYYYVGDYFATDELAETVTEINIVSEIPTISIR